MTKKHVLIQCAGKPFSLEELDENGKELRPSYVGPPAFALGQIDREVAKFIPRFLARAPTSGDRSPDHDRTVEEKATFC